MTNIEASPKPTNGKEPKQANRLERTETEKWPEGSEANQQIVRYLGSSAILIEPPLRKIKIEGHEIIVSSGVLGYSSRD